MSTKLLLFKVLSGIQGHVLIARCKDFLGLNMYDKANKRTIRTCPYIPDSTLYKIIMSVSYRDIKLQHMHCKIITNL